MKSQPTDPYIVKCANCGKDVSIKEVVASTRQPWKRVPEGLFVAKYYCDRCQIDKNP